MPRGGGRLLTPTAERGMIEAMNMDDLHGTDAIQAALDLSPRQARYVVSNSGLGRKFGGNWLLTRAELDRIIQGHRAPAALINGAQLGKELGITREGVRYIARMVDVTQTTGPDGKRGYAPEAADAIRRRHQAAHAPGPGVPDGVHAFRLAADLGVHRRDIWAVARDLGIPVLRGLRFSKDDAARITAYLERGEG
jgi:hypothetical protein